MSITTHLVSQFGEPRGATGHVVGWVMGHRRSNVERSRWAVGLLGLGPGDRVLEIGGGPGVAVAAAAATGAHVVGVDRSSVVIGQARHRNRQAFRHGQVELHVAPVEHLPDLRAPFDAALAINTLGFWSDPVAALSTIGGKLRPGGTMAVVSQPRNRGATAEHTRAAEERFRRLLDQAGYGDLHSETLDLDPPAVCVLGRRPHG
jgi:ubiquinone/menaquinone biosynthesis C-methylase UbiE